MNLPYSKLSFDQLIKHTNVCLEQAFVLSTSVHLQGGSVAHHLDEAAELMLLEYHQRLIHLLERL